MTKEKKTELRLQMRRIVELTTLYSQPNYVEAVDRLIQVVNELIEEIDPETMFK